MRLSFLQLQTPYVAGIIGEPTPEQTIASILSCEREGGEAEPFSTSEEAAGGGSG